MKSIIKDLDKTLPFKKKLNQTLKLNKPAIIAEVKKASPSKGIIKSDYDPIKIAKLYEKGGASCISVLTDTPFFLGKNEDLVKIKENTNLPILRKDFILSEYQIIESRAIGSDCILLILSILTDYMCNKLLDLAKSYEMDVLVEVHDEYELDRAIKLDNILLGINNRNLKNFSVNLDNTINLALNVPNSHEIICESGITSLNDLRYILSKGIKRFLIGEFLIRQNNIESVTKSLCSLSTNIKSREKNE